MTPEQQKLVTDNLNLVRWIINKRQYSPDVLSHQDAMSIGMLAICEAASRFDPSRGSRFASYAGFYIVGRIKDELRRRTGRYTHYKQPISIEKWMERYGADEFDIEDLYVQEPNLDETNFEDIISSLPERDQELVRLRFIYDLKMWQIAELKHMSDTRVSQVITRALKRLKKKLEESELAA